MKDQGKEKYFEFLDESFEQFAGMNWVAAMVCLYESDYFQAQVLSYDSADLNDVDWACNWTYRTEKIFEFFHPAFPANWQNALELAKKWTTEYLKTDRAGAQAMCNQQTVALGFASGDIHFIRQ